jgi:putative membrane protein
MPAKKKAKAIGKAAVIIGVLIIPLLYSYFYLGAFWDPYARLQDVPVAVVNLDKGAEINGTQRNVGQEICDSLEADGSVKFVFTTESDADSGLLGDDYYASIIIPEDFSENVSTVSQDTEKLHSKIT